MWQVFPDRITFFKCYLSFQLDYEMSTATHTEKSNLKVHIPLLPHLTVVCTY